MITGTGQIRQQLGDTRPCAHCARIGAIAAATQDALGELRAGLADMRTIAAAVAATTTPPAPATRKPGRRAGPDDPRLSPAELAVLHHIAAGKTNDEIGRDLYVSEDTVKSHARSIFRRLGARDRTHAVAIGYERGLIPNGTCDGGQDGGEL